MSLPVFYYFITVKGSTHLLSFVVISAVFVAVSRPKYLSEFYPSRTSVTHHVPQNNLSSVVAHMHEYLERHARIKDVI